MAGHADRNASLVIGQRLIARYQKTLQEKPPTPLVTERESKDSGVVFSQDAKNEQGPSLLLARHGEHNAHGTAHEVWPGMAMPTSDIPCQLRLFNES
jgi:hypothetical protein